MSVRGSPSATSGTGGVAEAGGSPEAGGEGGSEPAPQGGATLEFYGLAQGAGLIVAVGAVRTGDDLSGVIYRSRDERSDPRHRSVI